MNPHDSSDVGSANSPRRQTLDDTIPQLISQVYESAPADERRRLLQHLMQPLGVLSLVAVANGVFAKIWFRRGWHEFQVLPEDTEIVRASDVFALVDYVQQACVETVDGLVQIVSASPGLAGSAVAALLVATIVRRARLRRDSPGKSDDLLGS